MKRKKRSNDRLAPGVGCHGRCGVKVHVKNGRLAKVEGDENNPWNQGRLCPRVLAPTQCVYHPERLLYPLKRAAEPMLFCQGTGRDMEGPISFLAYAYGSPDWVQLGSMGRANQPRSIGGSPRSPRND